MAGRSADASLVGRMVGAARGNVGVYEDVERDVDATSQAAIVVLAVAIATGVGRITSDGIGGLIFGLIAAFVGWIVWSFVTYWVGTKLFKTAETRATPGELLRTLGFARSPGVLNFIGLVPILGGIVLFITWVWSLVLGIIAIRQALDFSTGRAIATGVVAFIPALIIEGFLLIIPRALF